MYLNDAFGVPVLCLLVSIAGGGTAQAAEEPLRIGLITPNGAGTDALAAGALVAVEEVNASGGIGGRPLHLVRAAPEHPWRGGAGRLAGLVFERDLIAVIGAEDGSTAHTVAQIATRRRIPVVTLSPESSLTRAMDPWVLRGVPDDESQARSLLRWALDQGAGKRLGLAVPEGRAGRERADSLRRAAAATGARVTCSMPALDCDAAGYDILMLWLDAGEALELLTGLDPQRLPEQILGSTRLDDAQFVEGLRRRDGSPASPLAITLLRSAGEARQAAPAGEAALAERLGHDLVRAVALSARRAGSDPLSLRDALRDGALFEGRSGRFEFDSQGNRREALRVGLWRRGGWEYESTPRGGTP